MLVVTAVTFGIYLASPVIEVGDDPLVIYTAESILHDQNTNLSFYGGVVNGFPCYRVGPRAISQYPWGTSLVAAPLLGVVELGGSIFASNPADHIRERQPRSLERGLGSVLTAFAVLMLMVLIRELTQRIEPALLGGVLFAFGTQMWSTLSRGLWQHGPLVIAMTIGLLLLARGRRTGNPETSAWAGLPMGIGFAIRPTAASAIAVMAVLLLLTERRALLLYAVSVAVPVVITLVIDQHVYGTSLNPYYFHSGNSFLSGGLRSSFLTALAGTLVSPSRGLFIFSPILLFAGIGLWWTRGRPHGLELACAAVCVLIWLSVSNTAEWAGGGSYGPRLMSDALPFLAVLLAPVLDAVTRPHPGWTRPVAITAGLLGVAFAWSAFTNARGALSWATEDWDNHPVSATVGTAPGRFWDWSDPQFLRTGHITIQDVYGSPATPPVMAPASVCAATA